jgi:hypothetical protein
MRPGKNAGREGGNFVMPVKSARKPARKSAAPRRSPASGGRIPTTHVGSLVRPPRLREFLAAQRDGQPYDEPAF